MSPSSTLIVVESILVGSAKYPLSSVYVTSFVVIINEPSVKVLSKVNPVLLPVKVALCAGFEVPVVTFAVIPTNCVKFVLPASTDTK